MATFKDLGDPTQSWIHDLVKSEIHPEADHLLGLNRPDDVTQLIEEKTIQFLNELRDCFNEYSKIFNHYSDGNSRFQDIKIYSLAQTVADFMLYRSQVKLIVSNISHGVIQIAFSQHEGSHGIKPMDHARSQDLAAEVGPFNDIHFAFKGERVKADQVARYYFSEFVKATREQKRGKPQNQALIEQFKKFLEEKGMDI